MRSPTLTTAPDPATVAALLDLTLDESTAPWTMSHGDGTPFTDAERHLVLNATRVDVIAARDLATSVVQAQEQNLRDLDRFKELTDPHFAALGPAAELGTVVASMPEPEQAEALAILARLS